MLFFKRTLTGFKITYPWNSL